MKIRINNNIHEIKDLKAFCNNIKGGSVKDESGNDIGKIIALRQSGRVKYRLNDGCIVEGILFTKVEK